MTDEQIEAAKLRLRTQILDLAPAARVIAINGLAYGGWLRFTYDDDGYLECEATSDNINYTQSKTGIPNPPQCEINAAWALAYDLAPKSPRHISNTQPAGTRLRLSRDDREPEECTVVSYTGQGAGQWYSVRFTDGDTRSIRMPSYNGGR